MDIKKGLFIVIDGGEGSGKTKLREKAKEFYGDKLVSTREPGGSVYGEEIRRVTLNSPNAEQSNALTRFHLFWAARADHMKNLIIPALNNGKIVLCDRFDASTFAYQIVAQGARELEKLFWVTREFHFEISKREPDIYVYLDVDPKIGLARKSKQTDYEENHFDKSKIEEHYKRRDGFKEFLTHKDRGIKSAIINAERSEEEVWEDFKKIVSNLTDKINNN